VWRIQCMQWLSKPNQPTVLFPNINRMTSRVLDLTVGAEAQCKLQEGINKSSRCAKM